MERRLIAKVETNKYNEYMHIYKEKQLPHLSVYNYFGKKTINKYA